MLETHITAFQSVLTGTERMPAALDKLDDIKDLSTQLNQFLSQSISHKAYPQLHRAYQETATAYDQYWITIDNINNPLALRTAVLQWENQLFNLLKIHNQVITEQANRIFSLCLWMLVVLTCTAGILGLVYVARRTESVETVSDNDILLNQLMQQVDEYTLVLDQQLNSTEQYSKSIEHLLNTTIHQQSFYTLFDLYLDAGKIKRIKQVVQSWQRPMARAHSRSRPSLEFEIQLDQNEIHNDLWTLRILPVYQHVTLVSVIVKLYRNTRAVQQPINTFVELETICWSHIGPEVLAGFIKKTRPELKVVEHIFQQVNEKSSIKAAQEKIKPVFDILRRIKTNAYHLDLVNWCEQLNQMEQTLLNYRDKKSDTVDLQPQIDRLNQLIAAGEQWIINNRISDNPRQHLDNALKTTLQHLVDKESRQLGRYVNLQFGELDLQSLSEKHIELITELAIQSTHNSLLHGIENPSERELKHKSSIGTIGITTISTDQQFEFIVQDDGRGLTRQKLIDLIRHNDPDKDERRLKEMSLQQLAELAFYHKPEAAGRASTAINNIARQLETLGGKLELQFAQDQGCRFSYCIPL